MLVCRYLVVEGEGEAGLIAETRVVPHGQPDGVASSHSHSGFARRLPSVATSRISASHTPKLAPTPPPPPPRGPLNHAPPTPRPTPRVLLSLNSTQVSSHLSSERARRSTLAEQPYQQPANPERSRNPSETLHESPATQLPHQESTYADTGKEQLSQYEQIPPRYSHLVRPRSPPEQSTNSLYSHLSNAKQGHVGNAAGMPPSAKQIAPNEATNAARAVSPQRPGWCLLRAAIKGDLASFNQINSSHNILSKTAFSSHAVGPAWAVPTRLKESTAYQRVPVQQHPANKRPAHGQGTAVSRQGSDYVEFLEPEMLHAPPLPDFHPVLYTSMPQKVGRHTRRFNVKKQPKILTKQQSAHIMREGTTYDEIIEDNPGAAAYIPTKQQSAHIRREGTAYDAISEDTADDGSVASERPGRKSGAAAYESIKLPNKAPTVVVPKVRQLVRKAGVGRRTARPFIHDYTRNVPTIVQENDYLQLAEEHDYQQLEQDDYVQFAGKPAHQPGFDFDDMLHSPGWNVPITRAQEDSSQSEGPFVTREDSIGTILQHIQSGRSTVQNNSTHSKGNARPLRLAPQARSTRLRTAQPPHLVQMPAPVSSNLVRQASVALQSRTSSLMSPTPRASARPRWSASEMTAPVPHRLPQQASVALRSRTSSLMSTRTASSGDPAFSEIMWSPRTTPILRTRQSEV